MAKNKEFSEKTVSDDPLIQFKIWYEEHLEGSDELPDAVSLGTASAEGRVSVRTVLLKDWDNDGFVFYTNYNSRKGHQIASNHWGAMHFFWPESRRQIRIEGIIEKISNEESERYFSTRPRESQISAWASGQSSPVSDRKYLEKRYDHFRDLYAGREVEKPPYWGGYRLVPDLLEFWQERDFRLHDRIVYSKENDGWTIRRLAP
jgi:pyridoxamine 5'-phosphate oxidase